METVRMVCTRCWLLAEKMPDDPTGAHGMETDKIYPATARIEQGILYMTPHTESCRAQQEGR